jgi:hypothetical protein
MTEPKEDGSMSRKRHKPEEIVAKLRQVDVLVSQGQTVADAIRSIGVTEVNRDRELAAALQHQASACLTGLQAAGPGGIRASLRRPAGCAIPTGSAGQAHASAQTNPELTFNPDHPVGADQPQGRRRTIRTLSE